MTNDVIDCVVVGAGPGGLTAAYKMRQAGLAVRVIEKEESVGGRMKGGKWKDGLWYDQGAQFLCEDGSPIVRLANEVGIRTIPFIFEEGPAAVHEKGELRIDENIESFADYARMRQWSDAVVASFEELQARLAELRAGLEGDDEEVSRRLHDELDRIPFEDLLGGVHPVVKGELDYVIKDVVSHDPSLVSGVQGALVAAKFDGMRFFYAEGGAHSIWIEIAKRIDGNISLGAEVVSVRDCGPHVEVEYRQNGVNKIQRAKYAIVATTADQVLRLVDGLPESKRQSLEKVTYGPFVSCIFLTNENTAQKWDGYTTIRVPDSKTLMAVVHQSFLVRRSEAARGSGGVIMTLSSEKVAARLLELTEGEIREEVTGAVLDIIPELEGKIEKVLVKKWERGIPAMTVGGYARVPDLKASVGRLHFCGDYMADNVPEMNPAIETAERAAAAIARALAG